MDSEVSLPESSSSSNTSLNSSECSGQTPMNEIERKSPIIKLAASPVSSEYGHRSQLSNSPNCRKKSVSDSSTTTSSSDNDDEEEKLIVNIVKQKGPPSATNGGEEIQKKRNQSTSPPTVKLRGSSGDSFSSSIQSRSNSQNDHQGIQVVNISHEDLSDVSDMETEKLEKGDGNKEIQTELCHLSDDRISLESPMSDLRHKLDKKKNQLKSSDVTLDIGCTEDKTNGNSGQNFEDLVKSHDEDALDFEVEEGECQDVNKDQNLSDHESNENKKKLKFNKSEDGDTENKEELEEGEVSDEDEKRPEETEPKPICRFYTRGQCTWGMSCRFLHPGVTDKGNYTMFDLVRPVPVPQNVGVSSRPSGYIGHIPDYHDFRNERPQLHHRTTLHHSSSVYPTHHDTRVLNVEGPVVVESAWERGLRTAKEMMRKANKRKEQDMDFEDKKMNLTLSPDELDKDPYYLKDRVSPLNIRHGLYQEGSSTIYSPDRFGRGPLLPQYDEIDPYGRSTRYRELPAHRMPQYEDERRIRPTREVIVQRVEPIGRGDEWNDPWMRSKSPGGRGSSRDRNDKRRRDRRSYSSNSSYSTSSSSPSDSSSESSHSPSSPGIRRRYNSGPHKLSPPTRKHVSRSVRSPSPVRRSKHSPNFASKGPSPVAKRRSNISPPNFPKGTTYSPIQKHSKISPTSKKSIASKIKGKRHQTSSSSESGSSDSSASDSDSDSGSSSSGSTSRSRDRTPLKRSLVSEKVGKVIKKEPPKKRSPISIEIKKTSVVGTSAFSSPTHSVSSEKDSKKSRREELLKQLRAVEDAIAKKRSKLA